MLAIVCNTNDWEGPFNCTLEVVPNTLEVVGIIICNEGDGDIFTISEVVPYALVVVGANDKEASLVFGNVVDV